MLGIKEPWGPKMGVEEDRGYEWAHSGGFEYTCIALARGLVFIFFSLSILSLYLFI